MARLLVSCGESSGDLYAAGLVRALRGRVNALSVFGLGGDRLAAQGASLLAHVRDLAVVGLLEVVKHLGRLRGIFARVLAEVDRDPPAAAVLVDYPDFNLRLARELKRRGIPVIYYVSPQIWAWRGGRIRAIRRDVAHMMVIFPFEEHLYRQAGVPVTFVGHPLVEAMEPPPDRAAFLRAQGLDPGRPVLALLPGSRRGEVSMNLPPMAGAVDLLARERPDLQFLLAAAPAVEPRLYADVLGARPVARVAGAAQAVLHAAEAAVVASGTATVEAALVGTPMIVVYRLSALTYHLGRPFVRVSDFAMVNLVAERRVVPELIQAGFTPENVRREMRPLLDDPARRERMQADLADVRRRLGGAGASARAASVVAEVLARGDKSVDTAHSSQ